MSEEAFDGIDPEDSIMERVMSVMVEGEWVKVEEVEYLDISEGMQGEDLLKFRWNGIEYESVVCAR